MHLLFAERMKVVFMYVFHGLQPAGSAYSIGCGNELHTINIFSQPIFFRGRVEKRNYGVNNNRSISDPYLPHLVPWTMGLDEWALM